MKTSLDHRNAVLEQKLKENPIDQSIATLEKAAKRQSRTNKLLTISIVFDLLLTVGLAFGWQQNHSLAVKADSNHAAIVRNCETGNDARANNKQLWDYLLAQQPSQPVTPEQQKRITDFKNFVDKTFEPRDCSVIN